MVRPIPITHIVNSNMFSSPIPLAIGLFASISLLVVVCAKQVRKKVEFETVEPNTPKAVFGSSPKRLMAAISHKAISPMKSWICNNKNRSMIDKEGDDEYGGVWRKAIMMGEKCQPLEFSGVIFYDYDGNRVSEMPKSPRASPLRNFNLPVQGLGKV